MSVNANFVTRRAASSVESSVFVWRRNRNQTKASASKNLGILSHTMMALAVVLAFGLIYLSQAGRIASYDYEAERLDQRIAELEVMKEDMAVENARVTAIAQIENSAVAKEMVRPDEVGFVSE
jgi:Tfp pilus assembly protein PilN